MKELAATVEAWAEILDGEIPDGKMEQCYIHAMRNKVSTFPLGAPELIVAWKEIRESERARPPLVSMSCRLQGDVCSQCNGTGYKLVEVNGYKVSKACDCEPETETE